MAIVTESKYWCYLEHQSYLHRIKLLVLVNSLQILSFGPCIFHLEIVYNHCAFFSTYAGWLAAAYADACAVVAAVTVVSIDVPHVAAAVSVAVAALLAPDLRPIA